jgi:hypothetical protein
MGKEGKNGNRKLDKKKARAKIGIKELKKSI